MKTKNIVISLVIIIILVIVIFLLSKKNNNNGNTGGSGVVVPPSVTDPPVDANYCVQKWCCPEAVDNIFDMVGILGCASCQQAIGLYTISEYEEAAYNAEGISPPC